MIGSADAQPLSVGENEIADTVAAGKIHGEDGAWAMLAARVGAVPSNKSRFQALGQNGPLHITDIATAIGAFMAYESRADNSSFDAYLSGRTQALTPPQRHGMELFSGKAQCSSCHSGRFQTDHSFHAIGIPQLSEPEIKQIISFLHSLTDPSSVNGRLGAPRMAPSGLKVDSLAD